MKRKRIFKWAGGGLLLALILWVFIAYWTSTNDCDHRTGAPTDPMRAVRYCEYGSQDVLKIKEIEKPLPNDNELLVRIRAASLNFIDAGLVRGPLALRLFLGLRKPRFTGFGRDFAGVVEAVGKNVTEFKPGDEVFGAKSGAVAEYLCVRKDRAALKPANITFEQAGTVTWASLNALQGLRAGKIHAGQKILINGASGVRVLTTAVTSVSNAFAICSANVPTPLFDNVNNHSFSERRRILKPDGICVLAGLGSAGPNQGQLMGRIVRLFSASLFSHFTDYKFERYTTTNNQADLKFLGNLIAEGKVTPFLEKIYHFTETAEALRYFGEGQARGKIAITIE